MVGQEDAVVDGTKRRTQPSFAVLGLAAASEVARKAAKSDATVLLLMTEGVTDPANFERIVGRPPR